MVRCDPRDNDPYFIRFPRLIIEVLSQSTERTDRLEKFLHYTQIETLQEYLLIAQDRVEVTLFGREKNWQSEIKTALHESVQLRSINLSLPLRTVYDQVL
jgi:Uma2 family endonuclease